MVHGETQGGFSVEAFVGFFVGPSVVLFVVSFSGPLFGLPADSVILRRGRFFCFPLVVPLHLQHARRQQIDQTHVSRAVLLG